MSSYTKTVTGPGWDAFTAMGRTLIAKPNRGRRSEVHRPTLDDDEVMSGATTTLPEPITISYNFLCHGENSGNNFTVPANMEFVFFSWHGEFLSSDKACVLFDWLRINYNSDILKRENLSQHYEKRFTIVPAVPATGAAPNQLGRGEIDTTITFFPGGSVCPNINLYFRSNTEVDPRIRGSVLGIYNTGNAQLQCHANGFPTPISGRDLNNTLSLFQQFGTGRFPLSNIPVTPSLPNTICRIYVFACRDSIPANVMNVNIPSVGPIPGIVPPPLPLTRHLPPHPGYSGGAKYRKKSRKMKKSKKSRKSRK